MSHSASYDAIGLMPPGPYCATFVEIFQEHHSHLTAPPVATVQVITRQLDKDTVQNALFFYSRTCVS